MDKVTSESLLLGAGNPLPSIPLHSSPRVLYRLRPDTSMERNASCLDKNWNLSLDRDRDHHSFHSDPNYVFPYLTAW